MRFAKVLCAKGWSVCLPTALYPTLCCPPIHASSIRRPKLIYITFMYQDSGWEQLDFKLWSVMRLAVVQKCNPLDHHRAELPIRRRHRSCCFCAVFSCLLWFLRRAFCCLSPPPLVARTRHASRPLRKWNPVEHSESPTPRTVYVHVYP